MLTERQKESYCFFKGILPELLSDPLKRNKYAVIANNQILGLYDNFENAYRFMCSSIPSDDSMIVQQIVDMRRRVEFLRSAVV